MNRPSWNGCRPQGLERRNLRWTAFAVLPLLTVACGCSFEWQYALSAVAGEIELLAKRVPIERALNDPTLSDEQREKLALLISARDYGEHVMGLNVNTSYRDFVNLQGKPLAWNLSASKNDAFEPYIWNIPIAGSFPYLGFFDMNQAIAERDRILKLGYDTLIYELDAYSTLGLLPDPVSSTMLERGIISLVDTVIHELLHNTVYAAQQTNFNESLATFVGRQGAVEFLAAHFGEGAAILEEARHYYEDGDRFNVFLQELVAELSAVYESERSLEEKLQLKSQILEAARQRYSSEVLPLMHEQESYAVYSSFAFNNAFLLLNVRYNTDLDVFEQVYELSGRNWGQALATFSEAANSGDPVEFLKAVVNPAGN